MDSNTVRVSYLELTQAPAPIPAHLGDERISRERLALDAYLELYGRVGTPLRWNQRCNMPQSELARLLESERSQLYILSDRQGERLGLCEFERSSAEVELRNFGLVPTAQGRGLGTWLLRTALDHEWKLQPQRIWLHTDSWDHPAAIRVYGSAGFRLYRVRDESPGNL